MDGIDWTLTWNTVLAIATVVMALAVAATVIYAWLTVHHNKKARYADLLMRLNQTWDSKQFIKSRMLVNKYCHGITPEESCQNLKKAVVYFDKTDMEEFYIIVRIANFFENLGFLGRKGYIIKEDSVELFGPTAKNYWNMFSSLVKYHRCEREDPQPDAWLYFEDFALGFPNKKERLRKTQALFQRLLRKISPNN